MLSLAVAAAVTLLSCYATKTNAAAAPPVLDVNMDMNMDTANSGNIMLDRDGAKDTFWGLGGLSGGGATTRLLVDYKEPYRSDILDFLFKPNYGASLQVLKVEIGGDSQSTDGTESSHMHDNTTIDLETGYEWWLMAEAKKRNPNIKLYGLPWAFPGWVGNDPQTGTPSGDPFAFPQQTSRYLMEWVKGAKTQYDLDIDYVGVWNERASNASYTESLRQTLNEAGFQDTKIVARDGGADICNDMAKDPAYVRVFRSAAHCPCYSSVCLWLHLLGIFLLRCLYVYVCVCGVSARVFLQDPVLFLHSRGLVVVSQDDVMLIVSLAAHPLLPNTHVSVPCRLLSLWYRYWQAKSIDIIGLHYPSDYQDLTTCHSFGKPVWASEESSSYDDLNGAACWARVVNSHYVLERITSSIMWNLVGAYYHGTNWYASSMLTSVQPWSGYYEMLEVVWATAHVTQFTEVANDVHHSHQSKAPI